MELYERRAKPITLTVVEQPGCWQVVDDDGVIVNEYPHDRSVSVRELEDNDLELRYVVAVAEALPGELAADAVKLPLKRRYDKGR